jgi:catechol 2,3-dioxygenase-like lactoylglutathione lyase family enzyme
MNKPRPDPTAIDRSGEDIGNIVELGHLNLRVPDQQTALVFYVSGLGLTRDPYLQTGVDNAWINVGSSQFHLPVASGPAQVQRGVIGMVMPDRDALIGRLRRVAGPLAGTRFGFAEQGGAVNVTCPWGNRLRVHAPDPARFGRMRLGMPYLEVEVAPGTVERIARFYRELLGAIVECGPNERGAFARVSAGLDESLIFRETTRERAAYDGHHVQVTLADFSGPHRRLLARGLITEDSNASQYRFRDIVDLDTAEALLTLEHEVRSMRHPLYGRRLVNRDPADPRGIG